MIKMFHLPIVILVFIRTFAFLEVRWAFSGDPKNTKLNNNPYTGDKYNLWNYVWYANESDRDNEEASSSNTYGADNLLTNALKVSIYVNVRMI